jgi:hypothetical protein
MSHLKHRRSTGHEISFDPSLYPRTYSVSSQYQTSWIIVGLVSAVGFPLLLLQSHGMNVLWKIFVAVPFVLFGGYLALEAFKLKVILEQDAIVVKHSFSSRRLLRCEIAEWRTGNGGHGTTTRILIPRDNDKKALKFPEIVRTDLAFFAWFVGISHPVQSTKGNTLRALLVVGGLYFTAFGLSAFSYSRWDHARNRFIHPVYHPWAIVVGLLMIGLAYWPHVANPPKLPTDKS